MPAQTKDLWGLVKYRPEVDPNDLAKAVQEEAAHPALDYRTRLLIRDSVEALQAHWGAQRFAVWLARSPVRERLEAIGQEPFEQPGFPTLRERLMEKTDPEDIRSYLRELGRRLDRPVRVAIGGSAALMLPSYLSRATDDIDIVDEVPAEIRTRHQLLDQLKLNYGLKLAHFQSHYLPMGWANRVHSLEPFGNLQVSLVDVYDVFLSKLFSIRDKDLQDLRLLRPTLDKDTLIRRLLDTTRSLLVNDELRKRAEQNWYILYGEPLPSEP
jgi:hypothetical protein